MTRRVDSQVVGQWSSASRQEVSPPPLYLVLLNDSHGALRLICSRAFQIENQMIPSHLSVYIYFALFS
jgi:hypothetical protein